MWINFAHLNQNILQLLTESWFFWDFDILFLAKYPRKFYSIESISRIVVKNWMENHYSQWKYIGIRWISLFKLDFWSCESGGSLNWKLIHTFEVMILTNGWQTEITNKITSIIIYQNIGWLDIPMNYFIIV